MAPLKPTTKSCDENIWQQRLVICFNVFLQLLLFILFLIYFGKPSVEKYLEQKTIVVTTEEFTNGIEPPAITIAAKDFSNNRSVPGWKTIIENVDFRSFSMFPHCQALNFSDMDACKMNDTINVYDFLKTARLGVFEDNTTYLFNSTSSSIWTDDMTFPYVGRIFTLKLSTYENTMKTNPEDALVFYVNTSFEYYIWVHDENFFLINKNYFGGFGNQLWTITTNQLTHEGLYQEITLTKKRTLNLDKRPCEEDPSYSFSH